MGLIVVLLVFAVAVSIGSFLNVCIYRIPLGKSIVYPPSHCPKCNARLKFFDLIPVLSYVILGGRCRYCKQKIPTRYLIVELITGLVGVAGYLLFGLSVKTIVLFAVTCVLIYLGCTKGIVRKEQIRKEERGARGI